MAEVWVEMRGYGRHPAHVFGGVLPSVGAIIHWMGRTLRVTAVDITYNPALVEVFIETEPVTCA